MRSEALPRPGDAARGWGQPREPEGGVAFPPGRRSPEQCPARRGDSAIRIPQLFAPSAGWPSANTQITKRTQIFARPFSALLPQARPLTTENGALRVWVRLGSFRGLVCMALRPVRLATANILPRAGMPPMASKSGPIKPDQTSFPAGQSWGGAPPRLRYIMKLAYSPDPTRLKPRHDATGHNLNPGAGIAKVRL